MSFHMTQFIAMMAALALLFSSHWIYLETLNICENHNGMFYVLLVFSYSSSWFNFLFSKMEHFYRKMSWLIKYSFIALRSLNWIFFHTPWHSVSFCFVWIFCLCGVCNMSICYAENYRNVQDCYFQINLEIKY